ncbi:unnamed protein product [Hermetia illucens]|uniref:Reverse transcriptase domain-containing protein n=1 Tax=Hermetia illucens TaxID=343691 RepID=A0A7R8Z1R5_HERIL|nr:unnamed protein product [Hermetia illucens]
MTLLTTIVERSIDAIKGKRKSPEYQRLLTSIRESRRRSEVLRERISQSTASETPEQTTGWRDRLRRLSQRILQRGQVPTDPVKTYIKSLAEEHQLPDFLANICQALTTSPPEEIISNFEDWTAAVLGKYGKHRDAINPRNGGNRRHGNPNTVQPPTSGRRRRAWEFKEMQRCLRKNFKETAQRLLDGKSLNTVTRTPEHPQIRSHYQQLFSAAQWTSIPIADRKRETILYQPISCEEIQTYVNKAKHSSPGLDGIDITRMRKIPTTTLAVLFNGMLLTRRVPPVLNTNRTVLVPKQDTGLDDINNWRPITIGSHVLRLFNKINGAQVVELDINRGLKQGDPTSPSLFNFVLDELISSLCEMSPKGTPCLAYADDIVLLADSGKDAAALLAKVTSFFNERGLEINIDKCFSIEASTVPGKKKIFHHTTSTFKIGNAEVKPLSVVETFKYLGSEYNASGASSINIKDIDQKLTRIMTAPLKPEQRLRTIKQQLIPRMIYRLTTPGVTLQTLKRVDKAIRRAVRKAIHLTEHCHNLAIHASTRCGGLGVFQFASKIPEILSAKWEKIQLLPPKLHEVATCDRGWHNKWQKMNLPSGRELKRWQEEELEKSFSGNGLHAVGNCRHSSTWIDYPPAHWSSSDYIRAIHLRLNLLPCRSIPTNPAHLRKCRAGCYKNETVCHILQNCPATHWQRIARHNYVARKVEVAATKNGWQVQEEPHIRVASGTLYKPDLLLQRDKEIVISDIGVHWEGPTPLQISYQSKLTKYSTPEFIEAVRTRNPNSNIRVLPFIVGARGAWCHLNKFMKDAINLPERSVQNILQGVLKGGIECHRSFMRLVW